MFQTGRTRTEERSRSDEGGGKKESLKGPLRKENIAPREKFTKARVFAHKRGARSIEAKSGCDWKEPNGKIRGKLQS